MPYGITQCYLPPGRGDIPAFTPAEAGTRLSDPGGNGCKAELTLLLTYFLTLLCPCDVQTPYKVHPASDRPVVADRGTVRPSLGRSSVAGVREPSGRDLVMLEHRIVDTLHYMAPVNLYQSCPWVHFV